MLSEWDVAYKYKPGDDSHHFAIWIIMRLPLRLRLREYRLRRIGVIGHSSVFVHGLE